MNKLIKLNIYINQLLCRHKYRYRDAILTSCGANYILECNKCEKLKISVVLDQEINNFYDKRRNKKSTRRA